MAVGISGSGLDGVRGSPTREIRQGRREEEGERQAAAWRAAVPTSSTLAPCVAKPSSSLERWLGWAGRWAC